MKSSFTIKVFLCFFLVSLLASYPVFAEKKSVLIITNHHIQINNQVIKLLKHDLLQQENLSVEAHHYQNITREQIVRLHPTLIVTLGTNAALLAPASTTPTLHALIPENNLQEIGLCALNNCNKKPSTHTNSYAIYLDQPLSRQLNLLSLILPSARQIGVITAPFSINKLKPLQAEITKLNLTLHTRHIENESELNRQLNKLIKNIDVLFTLPDPLIHNRNNIPYLLLSTYRHNIPVIGFSKTYVDAGAIAGIYSSVEQISQQISELTDKILYSPETIMNSSFPPKYFSIAINKSVARSLELILPDKQKIKTGLLHLEK